MSRARAATTRWSRWRTRDRGCGARCWGWNCAAQGRRGRRWWCSATRRRGRSSTARWQRSSSGRRAAEDRASAEAQRRRAAEDRASAEAQRASAAEERVRALEQQLRNSAGHRPSAGGRVLAGCGRSPAWWADRFRVTPRLAATRLFGPQQMLDWAKPRASPRSASAFRMRRQHDHRFLPQPDRVESFAVAGEAMPIAPRTPTCRSEAPTCSRCRKTLALERALSGSRGRRGPDRPRARLLASLGTPVSMAAHR